MTPLHPEPRSVPLLGQNPRAWTCTVEHKHDFVCNLSYYVISTTNGTAGYADGNPTSTRCRGTYLASSFRPFLPSTLPGPSTSMQRDSSMRQAIRVRLFLDAVACSNCSVSCEVVHRKPDRTTIQITHLRQPAPLHARERRTKPILQTEVGCGHQMAGRVTHYPNQAHKHFLCSFDRKLPDKAFPPKQITVGERSHVSYNACLITLSGAQIRRVGERFSKKCMASNGSGGSMGAVNCWKSCL